MGPRPNPGSNSKAEAAASGKASQAHQGKDGKLGATDVYSSTYQNDYFYDYYYYYDYGYSSEYVEYSLWSTYDGGRSTQEPKAKVKVTIDSLGNSYYYSTHVEDY